MKRTIFSLVTFAIFWLFVTPTVAMGKRVSNLAERPFLLYGAGNIALTSSVADKVTSASYTQNMRTPIVGVLGFGGYPISGLWVGARYENWFTGREFSTAEISQKDTLHLQLLGPEVGFVRSNPRVAYVFALGGMYPLEQRVSSSSQGAFSRGTRFWNYQARASMELKLNSRLNFHMEAGYRWLNLRNLSNETSSFLPEAADLNLSGPFVGIGLGFMF